MTPKRAAVLVAATFLVIAVLVVASGPREPGVPLLGGYAFSESSYANTVPIGCEATSYVVPDVVSERSYQPNGTTSSIVYTTLGSSSYESLTNTSMTVGYLTTFTSYQAYTISGPAIEWTVGICSYLP
jgi:hypothetical protein